MLWAFMTPVPAAENGLTMQTTIFKFATYVAGVIINIALSGLCKTHNTIYYEFW